MAQLWIVHRQRVWRDNSKTCWSPTSRTLEAVFCLLLSTLHQYSSNLPSSTICWWSVKWSELSVELPSKSDEVYINIFWIIGSLPLFHLYPVGVRFHWFLAPAGWAYITNWLGKRKHRKHSMYMEFEVLTTRSLYSFGTVQSGWLSQSRKLKLIQEFDQNSHQWVRFVWIKQSKSWDSIDILGLPETCGPHCHSQKKAFAYAGLWAVAWKTQGATLSCFSGFCFCLKKNILKLHWIQMFDLGKQDIDSHFQMRACWVCWVTAFEAIGIWDSNKHFLYQ